MRFLRRLGLAWWRRRYACLLASLLLTIGAGSVLDAARQGFGPLEAFLALNLLAAVVGAATAHSFRTLLALGFVGLMLAAAVATTRSSALLTVGQSVWTLGSLVAAGAILRVVLRSGPVDSERICAALSVYILFGLLCAMVFWLLEQTSPGAVVSARAAGEPLSFAEAMYFSFVTLATLGYGDLVPVHPQARGLAILEAIVGQLYLVVLVARLVSLHAQRDAGGTS
jgi:hypothetical protein